VSDLTPSQRQRNRVAVLSRTHPGSPELVEARAELAAIKLEEHIRRTVTGWPPLPPAQLDRLAVLLRGDVT
jgi:hypothetical protein